MSTQDAPLRLAILGVGDVAQRDYLPEIARRLVGRVEIVAVCGRTEDRVRSVAEHYGIATWYTDYHRMLRESSADAVVNLTPIQLHGETTLAALAAGKHVYTEKPLATTVADATRIRDEACRRGLVVVAAPCVMVFPQVRTVARLLAERVIGPVYSARGYGHGGVPPWAGFASDPSPYFAVGAGPAMDMGVYPLHALTGLLGPVRRVTAMSARAQECFTVEDGPAAGKVVPMEVDDNWHMILDFGEARLASVDANNCVHGTKAPPLELFGLHGTIAMDLLTMTAPVQVLHPGRGWEAIAAPQGARRDGPDHLLGIAHLADCLQNGRKPVLTVDHALHVVELIEKAQLAARTGLTQQLTSTF